MSVVVDCSVALNWVMPDEDNALADALLDRVAVEGGVVPLLFRIEVGNALLLAVRRRRITTETRKNALDRIGELPLVQDREGLDRIWTDCIEFAEALHLSLYDAIYLELARRVGKPLATLDARLAQAASQTGVALSWPSA